MPTLCRTRVPICECRFTASDVLPHALPNPCIHELFVAGSAPLLAETHFVFEARTGHAILERYGMTEAGMIASNPHDGPRRPGTVGRALPATGGCPKIPPKS